MSRRQFTTLKLLISLPLPAGKTQKKAMEEFKLNFDRLLEKDFGGFPVHQAIIKKVGHETTYL